MDMYNIQCAKPYVWHEKASNEFGVWMWSIIWLKSLYSKRLKQCMIAFARRTDAVNSVLFSICIALTTDHISIYLFFPSPFSYILRFRLANEWKYCFGSPKETPVEWLHCLKAGSVLLGNLFCFFFVRFCFFFSAHLNDSYCNLVFFILIWISQWISMEKCHQMRNKTRQFAFIESNVTLKIFPRFGNYLFTSKH